MTVGIFVVFVFLGVCKLMLYLRDVYYIICFGKDFCVLFKYLICTLHKPEATLDGSFISMGFLGAVDSRLQHPPLACDHVDLEDNLASLLATDKEKPFY